MKYYLAKSAKDKDPITRSVFVIALIFFAAIMIIVSSGAFVFNGKTTAKADESGIIDTREELFRAITNAQDGDTIVVGDVDFTLQGGGAIHESERMLLDKSLTIKGGVLGKARFKGGSFLINGTKSAGVYSVLRFENIIFDGQEDAAALTGADWELTYDEGTGDPVSNYTVKAQYAIMCKGNVQAVFSGCDFTNYMHEQGPAVRLYYGDYSGNAYAIYEYGDNSTCSADLTFRNCNFIANAAFYGGGAIYAEGTHKNVNMHFSDCLFDRNISGANDYSAGGGAVFVTDTAVNFEHCRFENNVANRFYEGAEELYDPDASYGGAVFCNLDCRIKATDCVFTANEASLGGGIALLSGTGTIDGCIFDGNVVAPYYAPAIKSLSSCGGIGGGLYFNNPESVIIRNTDIVRNVAANAYASIYTDYNNNLAAIGLGARRIEFDFCTVADNVAQTDIEEFYKYGQAQYEGVTYPGEFWSAPYVYAKCSIIIEKTFEYTARYETPDENNDWCYFATFAQATDDGYVRNYGEGTKHLSFPVETIVPRQTAQSLLSDGVVIGDYVLGANANPVYYDLYDGQTLISTVEVKYGQIPVLPAYNKKGFVFEGWATEDGEKVALKIVYAGKGAQAIKLYALLTPVETEKITTSEEAKKDLPAYAIALICIGGAAAFGVGAFFIVKILKKNKAAASLTAEPEVTAAPQGEIDIDTIMQNDPDVQTLSEREKEVLRAVLSGRKRKEIAEELFVTEATIKKHISSIYNKLGVTSRVELLSRLYRPKR